MSKQLNEFETNQEKKIQNLINSFFTKQESFITNQLQEMAAKFKEELKNNIAYKLQAINNQFSEYKSRMIYVQIDVIKLLNPTIRISQEQIKSLVQSYQTHTNAEITVQNIQSYVKNLFNDQ